MWSDARLLSRVLQMPTTDGFRSSRACCLQKPLDSDVVASLAVLQIIKLEPEALDICLLGSDSVLNAVNCCDHCSVSGLQFLYLLVQTFQAASDLYHVLLVRALQVGVHVFQLPLVGSRNKYLWNSLSMWGSSEMWLHSGEPSLCWDWSVSAPSRGAGVKEDFKCVSPVTILSSCSGPE